MQLDFAFLAQYAEYVSDGKMAIFGAGIDGIESSVAPFQANQMSLVAKFVVERDDTKIAHTYRIEVTDSTGQRRRLMADQSLNTEIDEKGPYPAGSNLIVNLLMQFKNFGQYYLHLMLDNEEVKQLSINVSQLNVTKQKAAQPEEALNG